jgi:hypothetical protein
MRLFLLAPLLVLCGCTDRAGVDAETTGTGTGTAGTTEADADPTSPNPAPTTTGDTTTGENPAGACKPVDGNVGCPADYQCCSDDPAATEGRLPNYFTQKIDDKYGLPIFSANNNPLSYSGQCVLTEGFPSPFPNECPVPCNPRWTADQVGEICGTSALCCALTEVDPDKDCVIDPETSRWRAVRGTDIPALTNWGMQHTTNQDPFGESCALFAGGGGGTPDSAALADCYAQLTVADQRGFCFKTCPCQEDLCDQKNPDYVARCSANGS